MLEQIQTLDPITISWPQVLFNLGVALVCGLVIAIVYRAIYKGTSYSSSYVNSLILLTMITAVVIMVIGNNLARAFGLVGAMSIIRFRTAIRDVQDIVFIFLALAVGLAAGVGLFVIAITGTLVICFISVILVSFHFGDPQWDEHLLQLSYEPDQQSERVLDELLNKYCRKIHLTNMKTQNSNQIEAFYRVVIRRGKDTKELLQRLGEIRFVLNVNIYHDEEDRPL
ncbi:MAG: DUF4956 domain-containing protein [Bacteroidales bacterium]|nr:DUF4956 domain-containing protein [Bacteroidales bacterium]